MFDCLSVRFTNVRMCSIGKMFRRVRLSSIRLLQCWTFDYVRLFKCSIYERSNVFDW